MAALTTIALAVSLAATTIGAGVAVAGQVRAAKATKAASEFNAKVAENEAISVERERKENARRKRIDNRRKVAKQRTLIAKAGVLETGSPLDLMAETAGELELQVLDLNRVSEARKTQLRAKAGITRFEGQQRAKAFQFGAATSGLQGVAQGASLAV